MQVPHWRRSENVQFHALTAFLISHQTHSHHSENVSGLYSAKGVRKSKYFLIYASADLLFSITQAKVNLAEVVISPMVGGIFSLQCLHLLIDCHNLEEA